MGRQPLPVDTILGIQGDQYRIDTVLGPGGFGITYLARSLRLDRDVAIKEYFPTEFAYREGSTTIRPSVGASRDFFTEGKRYFIEEARVLGRFRHAHIVRVIGLIEQNNTAYMILEFEEGTSFKQWLKDLRRRPTQDEIDVILDPMLSALETIHSKGLFHRDIAPDNIIIRPNGQPVLIDFGAARQFARENSHTLGAIVKHGYSPPEQYTLDTKLQGAWSDIYALCATMYHAMTGEPPEEASKRQLHDTILPIERHMDAYHRSLYHPNFIAGINAGLTLRPKDRPATVAELREIMHHGDRSVAATVHVARDDDRPATLPAEPLDGVHPFFTPARERGAEGASANIQGRAALAASSVALVIAAVSALGFLGIGGIEHPGGFVSLVAVCAGLCLAALERTVALWRTPRGYAGPTAVSATAVLLFAFAIFWIPLFVWPLSVLLAVFGAALVKAQYKGWISHVILLLSVAHLGIAAWILLGANPTEQKNPWILPLMGTCLTLLALLGLISAIRMRQSAKVASETAHVEQRDFSTSP